jgi:leucyl aminopeptidase
VPPAGRPQGALTFPTVPLPTVVLADAVPTPGPSGEAAEPATETGSAGGAPSRVVLALPTVPDGEAARLVGPLPDATGVQPVAVLAAESAKAGPGEVVSAPGAPGSPIERVLLAGTGTGSPADLRKAGAALARRAKDATSLTVDLRGLELDGPRLRALVEGLLLASYSFSRKKEPLPRTLASVTLVAPAQLQPDLDAALAIVRATAVARDLVNTPSLQKSPQWLAETAAQLLQDLEVDVLDERELARRGFGGILGVGQGSTRPPRLVHARYDGGAGGPHVVLVGKGITFDSGGLSLKPNASMLEMKGDMGGAAAVLATLRAVADLRLPIRVTALAAIAENMPSGTAQRPGDVLVQYGGRTVEVLNTDAEGRLVLADALAFADQDLDADVLLDVATLTGAMPVALGKRVAGLFTSDDGLAAELEHAAETSGEPLWRMPLVDDYRVTLDSPIADLRNIGQPRLKLMGGSITAALFLREFTGGRPWAHLDIAGPAFTGSDDDERTKGGTGYGARLLTAWLSALSAGADSSSSAA